MDSKFPISLEVKWQISSFPKTPIQELLTKKIQEKVVLFLDSTCMFASDQLIVSKIENWQFSRVKR